FFRKPVVYSFRQFAFVTETGGMMNAGSRLLPFLTLVVVVSFLPLRSSIADLAAAVARNRVSFHTVMVCQPEMMFWTPWGVASWPLSGTGFRPWLLSATTTAFASPSLAAATASILLPVLTSICSKIVPAFWLSQPGTNWSGPFLNVPA